MLETPDIHETLLVNETVFFQKEKKEVSIAEKKQIK